MSGAFGGGKSKPQAKSVLGKEQQALLANIIGKYAEPMLGGIPESMLTGWPEFNRAIPGLGPLESMSLAGLENLASGKASGATGSEQFAQGREVIGGILGQGPEDISEYFTETVEKPTWESVRETAIPGIRGAAVGSGTLFGGQTRTQESQLYEDVYDTMGRERARVAFEERDRDLNRKLAAIENLVGLQQGEAGYLGGLLGAGGVQRESEIQQYGLALTEFVRQLEERDKRLALASNLATSPTRAVGQSTSQGGDWGSTVVSALGSIIGAAVMSCSASAIYYGYFTPEWRNARRWFVVKAPRPIRVLYARYSWQLSRLLIRYRLLRAVLRPLFKLAERRGRVK